MIAKEICSSALSAPDGQMRGDVGLAALIFDLDGTLYPLRPVRIAVFKRLLWAYLSQPIAGIQTLRALAAYRRAQELLRASERHTTSLREAQVQTASQLSGLAAEFIEHCVSDWMEERPLQILPQFVHKDFVHLLESAKAGGMRTAVCSDYPARRKIEALGLSRWFDLIVSAQDPEIGELKPSPKILKFALEKLEVPAEQALYIGDRVEIDGAAAKRAGVHFHLLKRPRDLYQVMTYLMDGYPVKPLELQRLKIAPGLERSGKNGHF
jgi:HAD superfamily hydrolase (TIGR01549 family)